MVKIGEILEKDGIDYQVVDYGKSTQDPDEILQQYGKDILYRLLNRLIDKYDYTYLYYKKRNDLSSSQGRRMFAETMISVISKITDPLARDILINRLSIDTGITKDILNSQTTKNDTKIKQNVHFDTVQYAANSSNKAKSKLDKIQRTVLEMMLSNKDAIKVYEENPNINFIDSIYLEIANYAIDIYESTNDFDSGILISKLQQSNNPKAQILISTITELQSNEYSQPYSRDAMVDNLESLKREYIKNKIEFKFRNESYGKDYSEQAKILQNYVDSQKGEK